MTATTKKKEEVTLDTIIGAYESKYAKEGESLVLGGDEIDNPRRLWPGSLEMAYAMGGGFPVGRWGRAWGPKSSGKTKTAYSIAASAQRDYGMTVAYINAENQFYKDFAIAQGVDVRKSEFKVVGGKVIEQVGEFIEGSMPYIDLFIIDSTSACISAAAKEAGIDSERPMMDAKAWTKVSQFMNDAHDPTRNTVIFIDQVRIGSSGGGMMFSEKPSGGFALEHYSSLTAKFTAGAWLYRKGGYLSDDDKLTGEKTVSKQKEPDGRVMKVRVEKSRVGPPFRTATLYFDYNTGDYEPEFEYEKWAKHLGLIEYSGTWAEIDGKKVQGSSNVRQYIRDNPDLQQEIIRKVLANA